MKRAIIIGNGPAGISAAIYTARANIDTLVLGKDTGALGTALVENYYGFEEPVSGPELVERGIKQAERIGATVKKEEVISIAFSDNDEKGRPTYCVKTNENEYLANAIVIAVGQTRKKSEIKNLSELEGMGVSYCAICDAFFYKNKDVAVIGNGKFALNEASELLPIVGSVTVLTNGKKPEANFPAEMKIIETEISSLNKNETTGALNSISFEDNTTINFAGAFVAEGMASSVSLAKKMGIFIENNKIQVDRKMQTNISGIYAAGDCTGGILQIAKAVSDGCIAGISIMQYLKD